MHRNQLATEAAAKSRNARRASLVVALLVFASTVVWRARAEPERLAEAAPRDERASTASARENARIAPVAEHESANATAAERAALDLAPREPATAASSVTQAGSAPTAELAQVRVLVLGLGRDESERATVEALVFDAQGATQAHAVHETDEQGWLALELPVGQLRLSAWTRTQVAASVRAHLTGADASFELRLERAESIVGRVTDASTGAPIQGARVTLPSSRELAAVLTGADGRYELMAGAEQQHPLHCVADGYAFERARISLFRSDPKKHWVHGPADPKARLLSPSAPLEVDFELLPARTIVGEVRNFGAALAGASIEALGHLDVGVGSAAPDKASTTSDALGAFALHGLRPDISHVLTVRHPGHAKALLHVPASNEPHQDVGIVQLDADGSVELRVLDAAGTPIEGVQFELETPLATARSEISPSEGDFPRSRGLGGPAAVVIDDRTGGMQSWHPDIAAFALGRKRAERTGTDGMVRFTGLASGRHAIVLHGYEPDVLREPVELRAGEQRRIEIVLPAAAPISGRVLDASGPIEGARVDLGGMGWRFALSDAEGRFSFSGLIDGTTYHVHASWTPPASSTRRTPTVEAKPGAVIELRAE